jgi:hypothetical protein
VKFVGGSVTFSASFKGTEPIQYQWQVNKGSGPTNIVGKISSTLVLTNLSVADAGEYSLYAYNAVSANQSTPGVLTVYPTPSVGTTVNFQWHSTEGGDAGTYSGTGLSAFGSGTYWNQVSGPTIWTPGTYVSSSGFADDGTTDTGISWTLSIAGSWSMTEGSTIPLLDSYAIAYDPQSFVFNVPNGRYNLALFSCNGYEAVISTNSAAVFTVNGVSKVAAPKQHSSFVEGNNYVVFSNVVVAAGSLSGTWAVTNGLSFGSLNGAQLRYLGAVTQLPTITLQRAGNQLTLSWPSAGWTLQAQTNSLVGTWSNIAGSSSTTSYVTTVNPAVGNVFYRLKQ